MLGLLDHLQIPTITVLGHDWGGGVAWRFAQFYPDRVLNVGNFCTPYFPPGRQYVSLEQLVERLPSLTYQLTFRTPEAEKEINENIEAFYSRVFRTATESEDPWIGPDTGTVVAGRPLVKKSDLVPQKVFDHYVALLKKTGIHGGMNWYRQNMNNYIQCKGNIEKSTVARYLFIY